MANAYITVVEFFAFMDERTALELSTDSGAEEGSTAKLQVLLDTCAAQVDTVLYGRVTLPLTNTTALNFLRGVVADLAHGRLYLRRSDVPKDIKTAYDAARDWLKDFMAGMVTLPGADAARPVLQDSDYMNGDSRFSNVLGQSPTPTAADRNARGW